MLQNSNRKQNEHHLFILASYLPFDRLSAQKNPDASLNSTIFASFVRKFSKYLNLDFRVENLDVFYLYLLSIKSYSWA